MLPIIWVENEDLRGFVERKKGQKDQTSLEDQIHALLSIVEEPRMQLSLKWVTYKGCN